MNTPLGSGGGGRQPASLGAGHPDRDHRRLDRDQPQLGSRHRQRRRHRLPRRPLPGRRLHELLPPGANLPTDGDVQRHGALAGNDLHVHREGDGRRRQHRPRLEQRRRDDGHDPAAQPRCRLCVRRGVGNDRRRCLGQQPHRHARQRKLEQRRQVRRSAVVQRLQRARRRPRRSGPPPLHRHDARGLGQPHRRGQQLARRHLQGQRQLLPRRHLRATAADPPAAASSAAQAWTPTAPSPLPANAWSHLALTYDGATLRLYVNGTLVGSHAKPAPSPAPPTRSRSAATASTASTSTASSTKSGSTRAP